MPTTGQFYTNEQLTSGDLQNAVSLLSTSINNLVTRTMYNAPFVILNGLSVSQTGTADNGVQVAAGLAYQNGETVLVASQQGVNILPGSYPNGTGLAADSTYARIDVVYIQYAQGQTNLQTRTFAPPGQPTYTQSVYTEFVDGYTLSVVHGAASASPVVPSAPSGSVVLAQVNVPANATTITTADITDETASYRTDGGRLALATNNLLKYISSTQLGTPAGIKVGIGDTAYLFDNQTTNKLDINGGTNGVNHKSSVNFGYSGTALSVQPATDAASGSHVISLKNASGTEYGYWDNNGYVSVAGVVYPNLSSFPPIQKSGTMIVVMSMPYVSNGTAWVDPMINLMQLSTTYGGTADFRGPTVIHGGVGLTINSLAVPSGLSASNAGSGSVGSNIIANTTYTYELTAVSYNNTETSASTSASVTTGATAYPINLSWTTPTVDTQYINVYKDGKFLVQLAGTTTSYQDTGNTATTSQTPPSENETGDVTIGGSVKLLGGAIALGDQSGTAAWIDSDGNADFGGAVKSAGSDVTQVLSGGYKEQNGTTGSVSLSAGLTTVVINLPDSFNTVNSVNAQATLTSSGSPNGIFIETSNKDLNKIDLLVYSTTAQTAYFDWLVKGT